MQEIGSVEKGTLGELYVFSKLIEKGAMPFTPIADIHGVDAVVRRKDGRYVEIQIKTTTRNDLVDITPQVEKVVEKSGVAEGICVLVVPHTTAAVTINERADPAVPRDILMMLNQIVPYKANYTHMEGNSDAHIKATLVGPSEHLIIRNGRLLLGTWQAIFFCEFDGPRSRRVHVKVSG